MDKIFCAQLVVDQYLEDKKNGLLHKWDADELRFLNSCFKIILDCKLNFYEISVYVLDSYV